VNINGVHNFDSNVEQPYVILPKMSLPTVAGTPGYTSIVNRGQIVDFSQDLLPRMGVERMMTQQIYRIPEESGPNGEPVFGVVGDRFNQVRVVGSGWKIQTDIDGACIAVPSSATANADYIEISFYGTGINILVNLTTTVRQLTYSMDGGTTSANFLSTYAAILNNRNYAPSQIIPVLSNQTFGVHTIRIFNNHANGINVYGFEVLNETNALIFPLGSALVNRQKLVNKEIDTVDYKTGFETGTLGTKGGCVVTYLKPSGTIGKVVTPTSPSVGTLTGTDHSNEELIREYFPREFGCGRSDDFSLGQGVQAIRAFTLDDNLTTLAGNACGFYYDINSTGEHLSNSAGNGNFVTVTFFGTGLDIVTAVNDAGSRGFDAIYVDGVSIGGISYSTSSPVQTRKICSGLSVGTHTVRFLQTTVGYALGLKSFKVYGPKKPSIPSGCVELSQYYLNADYSPVPVGSNGDGPIATGIIFKAQTRELVYVGTWALSIDATRVSGFINQTSANGDYFDYTFFGTGIGVSTSYGSSHNIIIYIDDVLYTGSAYTTNTSTWTPGSSAWGLAGSGGCQLWITGLSIGKHKIRVLNNAAINIQLTGLAIITPLYFPKSQLTYDTQNTTTIGSSIGDTRKFQPYTLTSEGKAVYKAIGVTANASTSSSAYVPMPDMSLNVYSKGGMLELHYEGSHYTSASSGYVVLVVDGKTTSEYSLSSNYGATVSLTAEVYLSKGFHKIDAYWKVNSGIYYRNELSCCLIAKEL
jgi:hypothetical protein